MSQEDLHRDDDARKRSNTEPGMSVQGRFGRQEDWREAERRQAARQLSLREKAELQAREQQRQRQEEAERQAAERRYRRLMAQRQAAEERQRRQIEAEQRRRKPEEEQPSFQGRFGRNDPGQNPEHQVRSQQRRSMQQAQAQQRAQMQQQRQAQQRAQAQRQAQTQREAQVQAQRAQREAQAQREALRAQRMQTEQQRMWAQQQQAREQRQQQVQEQRRAQAQAQAQQQARAQQLRQAQQQANVTQQRAQQPRAQQQAQTQRAQMQQQRQAQIRQQQQRQAQAQRAEDAQVQQQAQLRQEQPQQTQRRAQAQPRAQQAQQMQQQAYELQRARRQAQIQRQAEQQAMAQARARQADIDNEQLDQGLVLDEEGIVDRRMQEAVQQQEQRWVEQQGQIAEGEGGAQVAGPSRYSREKYVSVRNSTPVAVNSIGQAGDSKFDRRPKIGGSSGRHSRPSNGRSGLSPKLIIALVILFIAIVALFVLNPFGQKNAETTQGSTTAASSSSSSAATVSAGPSLPTPIMSESSGVVMHSAVAMEDLTEVLIHNASYAYANEITTKLEEATNVDIIAAHGTGRVASEQPTGDNWMTGEFIRCFREGNAGPRMSAIDCGGAVGTTVYAPVTGKVVLVKEYKLYEQIDDYRIHIQPDGRPDLDVVLIHLTDVTVQPGDRVVAGVTPMAKIRDIYQYLEDSMQLKSYTAEDDNGNHTHIQVNDATDPEYHGLDDIKPQASSESAGQSADVTAAGAVAANVSATS